MSLTKEFKMPHTTSEKPG